MLSQPVMVAKKCQSILGVRTAIEKVVHMGMFQRYTKWNDRPMVSLKGNPTQRLIVNKEVR